ncbi:nitrogenase-stabilizing/protective protein NifW [Paraburkholderia unamae]|uniref:Nitrogenase-stabilizing/protective protein NifW n=2 Tax=Paraburkholderia TaxID=1822464 RepID=A0ABU9SQ71_9BURK|nr:nitrogenase-stabilizing/protective protein NifW [Paraburkholderia nodosa]
MKLNRLHIMKRFFRYIEQQDDAPPSTTADLSRLAAEGLRRLRCIRAP